MQNGFDSLNSGFGALQPVIASQQWVIAQQGAIVAHLRSIDAALAAGARVSQDTITAVEQLQLIVQGAPNSDAVMHLRNAVEAILLAVS